MQLPHTAGLVNLMEVFTAIADGRFVVLLFIVLALVSSYRNAIILLMGFLLSGLLVQGLKNTVFTDVARPVKWFKQQEIPLEVPAELKPHENRSFPSGHSATAAALMTFLAFRSRNLFITVLCLAGLLIVPYTRVYLFHHFPEDLAAGIFLGLISQLVVEYLTLGKLIKLERRLIRR